MSRQKDKWTKRQMDKKTNGQKDKTMKRQKHKITKRQKGWNNIRTRQKDKKRIQCCDVRAVSHFCNVFNMYEILVPIKIWTNLPTKFWCQHLNFDCLNYITSIASAYQLLFCSCRPALFDPIRICSYPLIKCNHFLAVQLFHCTVSSPCDLEFGLRPWGQKALQKRDLFSEMRTLCGLIWEILRISSRYFYKHSNRSLRSMYLQHHTFRDKSGYAVHNDYYWH